MMLLQQLAECCWGDLKKRGVLYIYILPELCRTSYVHMKPSLITITKNSSTPSLAAGNINNTLLHTRGVEY